MTIPNDQWLHIAKRLPVGQSIRVHHGREGRANLIITNDTTSYWCWCHRCHEGGSVDKTHVRFEERPVDVVQELPADIIQLRESIHAFTVLRFIMSKGVDPMFLPELFVSESRHRIMLRINGCWHGRDYSDRSPAKWMNYSRAAYAVVDVPPSNGAMVVTEDIFSAYKVAWAMRHNDYIGVMAALGTHTTAVAAGLLSHTDTIWFMDGDKAGREGAEHGAKRMRAFGKRQSIIDTPEGKDPKDLTIAQIRALIEEHIDDAEVTR